MAGLGKKGGPAVPAPVRPVKVSDGKGPSAGHPGTKACDLNAPVAPTPGNAKKPR